MGKGSQQVPTESTVRQTQLPEYADPYFRRLLQGAEEVTMPFDPTTGQSTYIPYGGERIAPSEMYGDIQASRAMVRGIAETGIEGMPEAMGAARRGMGYQEQAIQGMRGLADYQTGQFDPYGGFSQARVGPYGGFQEREVSPYQDFTAYQPTEYTDFAAGVATPYQDFQRSQFAETQVSPFAGFEEQQVSPYAGFEEQILVLSLESFSHTPALIRLARRP